MGEPDINDDRPRWVDLDDNAITIEQYARLPRDIRSRTVALASLIVPEGPRFLHAMWSGERLPELGVEPWGLVFIATDDTVIRELGQFSSRRDVIAAFHVAVALLQPNPYVSVSVIFRDGE